MMCGRGLQMTKADNYFPYSPGGRMLSGLNGEVKSAHLLMYGVCFYRVLCNHGLTVCFPKLLGDCNTGAGTCVLTLVVPEVAQRSQVFSE